MRMLATIVIAAATVGAAAPASAETTPFPVCRDIFVNHNWVGVVCADPADPCVVYGGGHLWDLCLVR